MPPIVKLTPAVRSSGGDHIEERIDADEGKLWTGLPVKIYRWIRFPLIPVVFLIRTFSEGQLVQQGWRRVL